MHKNPFYYDDQVQEIYDANGVKKRDKVDIVRKGVEGKCSKSWIIRTVRWYGRLLVHARPVVPDLNKVEHIFIFYKIKVLKN